MSQSVDKNGNLRIEHDQCEQVILRRPQGGVQSIYHLPIMLLVQPEQDTPC